MLNNFKVMIIDDEQIIVRGIKSLYEWDKNGFSIVGEAYDGQRGLDMALELKPDIILIDINMPKKSGLEVISVIKNALPTTEFIIISGYDNFSYCQAALRLGAYEYILKPVDFVDLGNKLENLKSKLLNLNTENEPKSNLIEVVYNNIKLLQNDFLVKIIVDNMTDKDYIKKISMELNFVDSYYYIALIEYEKSTFVSSMYYALMDFTNACTHFSNLKLYYSCLINQVTIIVQATEQSSSIPLNLKDTFAEFHRNSGTDYFIAVSSGIYIDQLASAFRTLADDIKFQKSPRDNDIIFSIQKYLKDHLQDEINLENLSKIFHMNPYYISQYFKEKTGTNYSDYLQNLRINKACLLLCESKKSINEIAENVGFNDYRCFTKMFKKLKGTSPKQYKASNSENR